MSALNASSGVSFSLAQAKPKADKVYQAGTMSLRIGDLTPEIDAAKKYGIGAAAGSLGTLGTLAAMRKRKEDSEKEE